MISQQLILPAARLIVDAVNQQRKDKIIAEYTRASNQEKKSVIDEVNMSRFSNVGNPETRAIIFDRLSNALGGTPLGGHSHTRPALPAPQPVSRAPSAGPSGYRGRSISQGPPPAISSDALPNQMGRLSTQDTPRRSQPPPLREEDEDDEQVCKPNSGYQGCC